TIWCDDAGKIIDDGTVFRLAGDDFRICCQERHLPWLLDSAIGFDVRVREETEDVAALSLQGPCS
ncbi:MAG: aminomethyltransferase family protein, partial [Rhodobacteraceae bacterium]|nr:aminomethyltransferase family protein [Paracoccaceae bacterium]